MFISQFISHITIMPFCISQNTDNPSRCRYVQKCKSVTDWKIQPVSWTSINPNHAYSGGEYKALVFYEM